MDLIVYPFSFFSFFETGRSVSECVSSGFLLQLLLLLFIVNCIVFVIFII